MYYTYNFLQRIRSAHEDKQEAILTALLTRTFTDHVIVFIRTKMQCHRLHIILGLLGLRAAQLHGNMSQAQRLESLKQFKEEQIDILLTTDVAARGLDISGVQTVINFQLPNTLEQYIHRVGRTARAGMNTISSNCIPILYKILIMIGFFRTIWSFCHLCY